MANAFIDLGLMFCELILKVMWLGFLLILPIIISFILHFSYYYLKGNRIKRKKYKSLEIKNRNVLIRLLIDFPRQYVKDLFSRDPDSFPHHGLHLFCGEQGAGKTLAMIHFADRLHKQYPACKFNANFDVSFAEGIDDIDDIVFKSNGTLGMVQMIDEIQTWFNSLESKNFPLEMIQEICQQRKQRKMILGTSQVFTRVAKAIREQTTFIYLPITVFGCLTIVRVCKPKLDENGTCTHMPIQKLYFFVHTKELRESYDTYQKIERLTKKGFRDRSEQIVTNPTVFVPVDSSRASNRFK